MNSDFELKYLAERIADKFEGKAEKYGSRGAYAVYFESILSDHTFFGILAEIAVYNFNWFLTEENQKLVLVIKRY